MASTSVPLPIARRIEAAWARLSLRRPPEPAFQRVLADRSRYERQIDRLHQRRAFGGQRIGGETEDVSLSTVVAERAEVAKLLARTVASGRYELGPARLRQIVVGGKKRTVFSYGLLDQIVDGVVAEVLDEALTPRLSVHLYSYRSDRSWVDAVQEFAAFVRAHRSARPDPRQRGLYVLRRDIDAYTDSIPVDARSRIWSQLSGLCGLDEGPMWRFLESIVRPVVLADDDAPAMRIRGVPTGRPIASVAFNVYLNEADRILGSIPGAFYARYSDDLLFAHADADVVREAAATLERILREYRLRLNESKSLTLYLTGAGRASDAWPDAVGTTAVPFLGMRVAMDGSVALGAGKLRHLLREARARARNVTRAAGQSGRDNVGRSVASVVSALLDPDDAQLGDASAPLLARVVTDRGQLDWLDHALARIVAESVAGHRGASAFRHAPYRTIRGEWELTSVRRRRDRSDQAPDHRRVPRTRRARPTTHG